MGAMTDADHAKRKFIDGELKRNGFESLTLVEGKDRNQPDGIASWYSRLLTAYLVLAEGENVEGAFSEHNATKGTWRLLVFTETLLIVTDVEGADSGAPKATTHAYSRSRLSEMEVAASATIAKDELRYEWPGTLIVTLTYEGIKPIELGVSSTVEGAPDEQTFGRKLIVSLRKDLA